MMFKNSLKLFCSNFDKVWKLFFYTIIVSGIAVALLMPFLDEIKAAVLTNWTDDILNSIPSTGLLYGKDVAGLFNAIWDFSLGTITTLYYGNVWICVYIMFILVIVYPFMLNIGKYAVNEMLYSYMSSQTKVSFCSALIKTIRFSSVYAIFKSIFSIFWKALIIGAIYGITLVKAPIFGYFLPVVVIVGIALLLAIGQTFIAGWAPANVVYGFNPFKSYFVGLKAVVRRYGRVLSTMFIVNMIFLFLIMGFGLVSACILLPIYMGLVNMFEMVMFFVSQGMRYYIDGETVLSPKKLEQTDKIKKTKYLL